MMAKDVKKIAKSLGADLVGQVPETGGGAFGAAARQYCCQIAGEVNARPGQTSRSAFRSDLD